MFSLVVDPQLCRARAEAVCLFRVSLLYYHNLQLAQLIKCIFSTAFTPVCHLHSLTFVLMSLIFLSSLICLPIHMERARADNNFRCLSLIICISPSVFFSSLGCWCSSIIGKSGTQLYFSRFQLGSWVLFVFVFVFVQVRSSLGVGQGHPAIDPLSVSCASLSLSLSPRYWGGWNKRAEF